MLEVTPSAAADQDFLSIFEYGLAQWGFESAYSFAQSFDESIELLARHPDLGPARPELRHGIRSWLHRGYAIFYSHDFNHLVIERVLHGAADVDVVDDLN